ncbi:MAG: hypothetical protein ACXWCO_04860 [Caldimonas sp.]
MGCKDCDKERGSSHRDQARTLAERALKLAMSLPDDATCHKHFKKAEAAFLSSLRNMAASLSFAYTWSESELRTRADGFVFADAALTYGLEMARMNTGGGAGGSCTANCTDEKDRCRAACDNDPEAGYFCYFDCRLSYMACLARCITHGVFGGGVIAA